MTFLKELPSYRYPEDEIALVLEKHLLQEVVLFLGNGHHRDVIEKLHEMGSDLLDNDEVDDKDLEWFTDSYGAILEEKTIFLIRDLRSQKSRTHPDLVKVVKEINDPKRFKIVQIPANVQFHLMGDNGGCGRETIHENHRTWN